MKTIATAICALSALAAANLAAESLADMPVEKRQARSVHLNYAPLAPDADAVTVTARVLEVQTNSYFMLVGWDNGYCGLQDLHGDRVFIFSVWEIGDPHDFTAREADVPEEERAKVIYAAEKVVVKRFEHEGTGAKTMAGLPWRTNDVVTAKIEAKEAGEKHREYACYIKMNGSEWFHFATISTPCKDKSAPLIKNVYSFIEDFWRNGTSQKLVRRAEFGNVATRSAKTGQWGPACAAMFTADGSENTNIDGGVAPSGNFFLQTGGETKNEHAKPFEVIYLPEKKEME